MDRASRERLVYLWDHRDEIRSNPEWNELYMLIQRQLKRCKAPILASLAESKQNYIDDFFRIKVFETAGRNSTRLYGPRALCGFFNNYLKDCLRGLDTAEITDTGDEDRDDDGTPFIERFGFTPPEDCIDPTQDALDYRITLAQARSSARELLKSLAEWQLTILAQSTCADTDDKLTADALAKQLAIPAANYHLKKLGITKAHGGRGNPHFRESHLGKWITGFGVDPAQNNVACIHWLLIQLCHEALAWGQGEE